MTCWNPYVSFSSSFFPSYFGLLLNSLSVLKEQLSGHMAVGSHFYRGTLESGLNCECLLSSPRKQIVLGNSWIWLECLQPNVVLQFCYHLWRAARWSFGCEGFDGFLHTFIEIMMVIIPSSSTFYKRTARWSFGCEGWDGYISCPPQRSNHPIILSSLSSSSYHSFIIIIIVLAISNIISILGKPQYKKKQ